MSDKYEIFLYWSGADQVWVGEIPELSGCIAHGKNQEEALSNVKDAMQLWIDTAREAGDPVPKPKGRKLVSA